MTLRIVHCQLLLAPVFTNDNCHHKTLISTNMDLRSDFPFWLLDKGIIHSYPSLLKDIRTDIVMMGAGISGALTAWYLCHAGFKTVVVDKRHVGMGSTAAITALLQY